jgi:hypothetical protein
LHKLYYPFQKTETMKFAAAFLALVAGASAFTIKPQGPTSTALFNGPVIGKGGMADTRDPEAYVDEDPRKSISAAPSFEEYLKQRDGGGAAPAPAPAPVAAAPAPAPAAYSPPAPAPAPAPAAHSGPVIGKGGMADTRDPEAYVDEDPRKSISEAPSFEEYLKSRQN